MGREWEACISTMNRYLIGEVAWHRLSDRTLENFDWKGNEILEAVVNDLVSREKWDRGIGLIGWTGVGKTHLLISLYKERMWRYVYQNREQQPLWLSFYDLLDLEENKIRSVLSDILGVAGIVFIDDVWYSGQGELEKEIVKTIVYRCYDLNKILCWSSNLSVDRWDVDIRVKDRLREMCIVMEVFGESRRQ